MKYKLYLIESVLWLRKPSRKGQSLLICYNHSHANSSINSFLILISSVMMLSDFNEEVDETISVITYTTI